MRILGVIDVNRLAVNNFELVDFDQRLRFVVDCPGSRLHRGHTVSFRGGRGSRMDIRESRAGDFGLIDFDSLDFRSVLDVPVTS